MQWTEWIVYKRFFCHPSIRSTVIVLGSFSSSPDDVYLVLHLDRAQAVVDLVRHPVALEAAPPAVDPRVDVVPPAGQVRAPVDAELVRHQLGARGAVSAQNTQVK